MKTQSLRFLSGCRTFYFSRAMRAALLLFSIATLLAGSVAAVHGQSALDGFDPNANDVVYAVAVQADGKILIGGAFTTVMGVARNNIARLNADGTVDSTFNPNADDHVLSLAVQADGKILVGGTFTTIGGQTRYGLARLVATTGLADSFAPSVDAGNAFFAVVVQPNGKILAGGFFDTLGGQTRNNIARLDPTTGLADSFNPNPDDGVRAIAVQTDGRVLAGGNFLSIGGQARNYIARLDATTGGADSLNPNANDNVLAITIQPDGKILVGGDFNGTNSIGGQTRNHIARLNATTGLADSFDPNANDSVFPSRYRRTARSW